MSWRMKFARDWGLLGLRFDVKFRQLQNQVTSMNKEEICQKIDELIEKIETVVDLAIDLKKVCSEVLAAFKQ